MFVFDFFTLFVITNMVNFVEGVPCYFNENCTCDDPVENVFCDNFDEFPIFNITEPTYFTNITIRGRFQNVPDYAFYNVLSIYHVLIRDPSAPYAPISFEDNSFLRYSFSAGLPSYYFFGFKGMKYIPKLGVGERLINFLYIINGSFPVLSSVFFNNISTSINM